MDLFQMKNNVLSFTPQAMVLKPFKDLWTRDKTKTKKKALAEFSYIWFMEEINSPFFNIVNEKDRSKEISAVLDGLEPRWRPDKLVKAAQVFYRSINRTLSEDMLRNTMSLLAKINIFLASIDPSETYKDRNGFVQFKYDFKKVVDTSTRIPLLLESLKKTKDLVLRDKEDAGGMRGSLEKAALEDGV